MSCPRCTREHEHPEGNPFCRTCGRGEATPSGFCHPCAQAGLLEYRHCGHCGGKRWVRGATRTYCWDCGDMEARRQEANARAELAAELRLLT